MRVVAERKKELDPIADINNNYRDNLYYYIHSDTSLVAIFLCGFLIVMAGNICSP
jgi:hypothetical protein